MPTYELNLHSAVWNFEDETFIVYHLFDNSFFLEAESLDHEHYSLKQKSHKRFSWECPFNYILYFDIPFLVYLGPQQSRNQLFGTLRAHIPVVAADRILKILITLKKFDIVNTV
jgi:hypothetical protein